MIYETYGNITGAALMIKWDKKEHDNKNAWQVFGKPEAPDYF